MLPIPDYWSTIKKLMVYVAVQRKNKKIKASKEEEHQDVTDSYLKRYEKDQTKELKKHNQNVLP